MRSSGTESSGVESAGVDMAGAHLVPGGLGLCGPDGAAECAILGLGVLHNLLDADGGGPHHLRAREMEKVPPSDVEIPVSLVAIGHLFFGALVEVVAVKLHPDGRAG